MQRTPDQEVTLTVARCRKRHGEHLRGRGIETHPSIKVVRKWVVAEYHPAVHTFWMAELKSVRHFRKVGRRLRVVPRCSSGHVAA